LNIELHLNLAPLTVSNNVGTFSLPSARKARAETPPPQLERLDSFILPRVEHVSILTNQTGYSFNDVYCKTKDKKIYMYLGTDQIRICTT
jgi:hypothetical protein